MRVLEHSGRDLAEIQRLAGRAADPHHDQIITPKARLSQDGILGCDIETQGRSDRRVVAVRQLDDVLEDGFLMAPAHGRPSQAPLSGTEPNRAHDIEAIAHVLIPGGVGIGQELAWLRKFDSGIAS